MAHIFFFLIISLFFGGGGGESEFKYTLWDIYSCLCGHFFC